MCRRIPEVFIEMGLYRDQSCLLLYRTKTDIQALPPLQGDPLSSTQCILFHGGHVILQGSANNQKLMGSNACLGVCECVYVPQKMRQTKRVSFKCLNERFLK